MASTINGCGTAFRGVGQREVGSWRSATEWFVFLWIPLFPLSRVLLRAKSSPLSVPIPLGTSTATTFEAREGGGLRFKEVLGVYASTGLLAFLPGLSLLQLTIGEGKFLAAAAWAFAVIGWGALRDEFALELEPGAPAAEEKAPTPSKNQTAKKRVVTPPPPADWDPLAPARPRLDEQGLAVHARDAVRARYGLPTWESPLPS